MRTIAAIATAAALAVAAGSARADAGQNEHNCAGSFSSGVTPEFVAGGDFGQSTAASAQAGTRDDQIQALVDLLSNCGSTP